MSKGRNAANPGAVSVDNPASAIRYSREATVAHEVALSGAGRRPSPRSGVPS
jgi:hypothetical protein